MVSIAVLVSGGGTNLQALIDAEAQGKLLPGKLTLCVSSKEGAYALTRANQAGIAAVTLPTKDYADSAAYSDALRALLQSNGIQLVVLAGFMRVLSASFIAAFPNRIVNVHPSLIPAFCGEGFYGLRVHQAALEKGVKVTGATVHLVNEVVDGGEILLQHAVAVQPEDTPEVLQRRVMQEAEWVLLPQAVQQLCEKVQGEEER